MAPMKKLPKQSVDGLQSSQRHRSSSASEDSSRQDLSTRSSRHRRKPSTVDLPGDLSSPQADIPEPATEEVGLDTLSRRQSISTMRTSSTPFEAALTYTPTTHRISKAKKGKRVHACEFAGCGKVFTRAEHKRRHELNHNPEATFSCTKPGCRKEFHRIDLLQRHQERHDTESPAAESSHQRNISAVSIAQGPPSSMPTPVMAVQHTPTLGQRHSAGAVPIQSIMNPQDRDRMTAFPSTDIIFDSYGNRVPGPFADYSEGESSRSTISDQYGYNRRSISSLSSPYEPVYTPAMIHTTMAEPWVIPPVLPSTMFDDGNSGLPSSRTDPAIPDGLSFSDVDAFEWTVIRRDLSSVPGLVRDDDGTGIFDTVRWQSCLECYWQLFHPFFPIIHRPTFFTTKPSPLLAGAMVAIGSQYDDRTDARLYSLTLLEIATRLLQRRENINNKSRLSDLQTVILLEMLGKYRSRRTEPSVSPRFRFLYASLDQARYGMMPNPLALLQCRRAPSNAGELEKAHKFWIEQETRRRILQACFIIDTQQAHLFEQPRALVQRTMPQLRTRELDTTAPFPCDHELWESSPVEKWAELGRNFVYNDSLNAGQTNTSEAPKLVDIFQSRVLLSHIVSLPTQPTELEPAIAALHDRTRGLVSFFTEVSSHAAMMIKHTPIRSLLAVSGESWALGRKVETENDFHAAKQELRTWIENGEDSIRALWHSTQMLRSMIEPEDRATGERERVTRFRTTHLLQAEWVIYLATLVCWAHGFNASVSIPTSGLMSAAVSIFSDAPSHISSSSSSSTSTAHPTLIDPAEADAEMRQYLHQTDVERVELLHDVDLRILSKTNGLLETIRTRKIAGHLGGLMNEAERVLFRLVEGRSHLSHF